MFVYALKASKSRTLPLIVLIALVLAVLIALIWFPADRTMVTSAAVAADSDEDCAAYLKSLGYTVELPAASVREVRLPEPFDEALAAYNALQAESGFDLSGFAGQHVKCRTYTLAEHPSGVPATVHLYTYDGRVIGGDISADDGSFLHALQPTEGPSLSESSRKEPTADGTTG